MCRIGSAVNSRHTSFGLIIAEVVLALWCLFKVSLNDLTSSTVVARRILYTVVITLLKIPTPMFTPLHFNTEIHVCFWGGSWPNPLTVSHVKNISLDLICDCYSVFLEYDNKPLIQGIYLIVVFTFKLEAIVDIWGLHHACNTQSGCCNQQADIMSRKFSDWILYMLDYEIYPLFFQKICSQWFVGLCRGGRV